MIRYRISREYSNAEKYVPWLSLPGSHLGDGGHWAVIMLKGRERPEADIY